MNDDAIIPTQASKRPAGLEYKYKIVGKGLDKVCQKSIIGF